MGWFLVNFFRTTDPSNIKILLTVTNIIINTDIQYSRSRRNRSRRKRSRQNRSRRKRSRLNRSRRKRSRRTRYTPYKQLPEKDVQNREEKTAFRLAISSVIYTKSKLRSVQIYDFALITWKRNLILEANFSKVVYAPYVSSVWEHFILVEAIGTDCQCQ